MDTQILIENEKRNKHQCEDYDPQAGINCTGNRTDCGGAHVPVSLLEECPDYGQMTAIGQQRARIRHDFEFWCWRCVKITDKMTGQLIPFILNRPQRRLLAEMERQRLDGQPVRIILLKARQWGGSTLVQVYIAWLQLVVFKGKNSIIVGHKRNSSFAIKQMLRTILANYPKEMLDDGQEEAFKLVNVRESKDIQEITGRDCSICLTSSYSPDAARGLNLSFAHLSEVAFWNSNRNVDPNDLIRTVTGTIPLGPGTVIVMESTANGMNSFFYNEWQRAKEGRSAFTPVFVAWNEIDLYRKPLDETFDLDGCDEYEQGLWDKGCTLEQIYWYHEKCKEFSEHNLLKAEFPSDDLEAFENSMKYVFSTAEQEQIVENVTAPAVVGDNDVMIWQDAPGACKDKRVKWVNGSDGFEYPEVRMSHNAPYLVVLTVGSEKDVDFPSIISVWNLKRDNRNKPTCPELAAQWVGVMPLNLLAIHATTLAEQYGNALLVIENNDINMVESQRQQGTFIVNEVLGKYGNLHYGHKHKFMLEVSKNVFPLMFYELILNAKNNGYTDHDQTAAQAVAHMIMMPNGRYYADKGNLQQHIINRAEALYVIREITMKNT